MRSLKEVKISVENEIGEKIKTKRVTAGVIIFKTIDDETIIKAYKDNDRREII